MLSAFLQSNYAQIEAVSAAEFLSGFMWQFTREDKLDYIKSCFHEDQTLAETIDTAVQNMKSENTEAATEGWKNAATMFDKDIGSCYQVSSTYRKIRKFEEDVLAKPDA